MRMPSSVCRVLVVRASRGNDGCYHGQGSLSLPAHGALWRRDAVRSDGEYSSTLQRGADGPCLRNVAGAIRYHTSVRAAIGLVPTRLGPGSFWLEFYRCLGGRIREDF